MRKGGFILCPWKSAHAKACPCLSPLFCTHSCYLHRIRLVLLSVSISHMEPLSMLRSPTPRERQIPLVAGMGIVPMWRGSSLTGLRMETRDLTVGEKAGRNLQKKQTADKPWEKCKHTLMSMFSREIESIGYIYPCIRPGSKLELGQDCTVLWQNIFGKPV